LNPVLLINFPLKGFGALPSILDRSTRGFPRTRSLVTTLAGRHTIPGFRPTSPSPTILDPAPAANSPVIDCAAVRVSEHQSQCQLGPSAATDLVQRVEAASLVAGSERRSERLCRLPNRGEVTKFEPNSPHQMHFNHARAARFYESRIGLIMVLREQNWLDHVSRWFRLFLGQASVLFALAIY
jgi:hypothetical protein